MGRVLRLKLLCRYLTLTFFGVKSWAKGIRSTSRRSPHNMQTHVNFHVISIHKGLVIQGLGEIWTFLPVHALRAGHIFFQVQKADSKGVSNQEALVERILSTHQSAIQAQGYVMIQNQL